jgi:hypothetical protein
MIPSRRAAGAQRRGDVLRDRPAFVMRGIWSSNRRVMIWLFTGGR